MIISGHGGGNWYNFRDGSTRLLVDHAQGPLRFYQFSVQQVTSELSGEQHVSFFGTKYEGNNPMLTVSDSDHIRLFGHGGNAKGLPGASLFVMGRPANFLFANGVDGPTKIGTKSLAIGKAAPTRSLAPADRPPGPRRRSNFPRSNAPCFTNAVHRGETMKTRNHPLLALFAALILGVSAERADTTDAARPNVIVILADDLGYGDLGYCGSQEIRTPNLDRMAMEGRRCTSLMRSRFAGEPRTP